MPNRQFDDSASFRGWVRAYLDTTDDPTLEGACGYVAEKCKEAGISAPHSSTINRILKSFNVNPSRWVWRHKKSHE